MRVHDGVDCWDRRRRVLGTVDQHYDCLRKDIHWDPIDSVDSLLKSQAKCLNITRSQDRKERA
jgi:hypothetical protein